MSPPTKHGNTHLPSLTGLRFYAALIVVLYHFSVHFDPMATLSPIVGLGYTGVGFFFILSGFVLAWSHKPNGPKRVFYWRRFARVWPLHALTSVLAIPVILATNGVILWQAFPLVLTLTQAWVPPGDYRYAFNGPSWSLACEAFFYLLFPYLFGWIARVRRLDYVVCMVFVAMAFVGCLGIAILPDRVQGYLFYTMPAFRLGEFIIGICLAMALQRGWRPRFTISQAILGTVALYVTLMVGTLIALPSTQDLPYVAANLWLLPGFVAAIAAAAARDARGSAGHLSGPVLVRLGQWSFALYLVHELLIKLAIPVMDGLTFWPALGASLVVLGVSIGLSGALYEWFERPVEKRLRPLITASTPANA